MTSNFKESEATTWLLEQHRDLVSKYKRAENETTKSVDALHAFLKKKIWTAEFCHTFLPDCKDIADNSIKERMLFSEYIQRPNKPFATATDAYALVLYDHELKSNEKGFPLDGLPCHMLNFRTANALTHSLLLKILQRYIQEHHNATLDKDLQTKLEKVLFNIKY